MPRIDLKKARVWKGSATAKILDMAMSLPDDEAVPVPEIAEQMCATHDHVRRVLKSRGCLVRIFQGDQLVICACNPKTAKKYVKN